MSAIALVLISTVASYEQRVNNECRQLDGLTRIDVLEKQKLTTTYFLAHCSVHVLACSVHLSSVFPNIGHSYILIYFYASE